MVGSAAQDRLRPVIGPVIEKMGYAIVELISQPRRSGLQVHLVIHRPTGVGVADCEEVYRTVLPRIEVSEDRRDIHLEVSSPGLSRNMKSGEEFALFVGRRVRVLMDDTAEWVAGTIRSADAAGFAMQGDEGERHIAFSEIRKARLVETQEGDK